MADDPDYRAWVDGWCEGPIPGGESRKEVQKRAVDAFTEAAGEALQKPGPKEPLVFVTHGGVIMSVLSALAEPRRDYYDYSTPNLSGWHADCAYENGRIILTNVRKA